MIDIVNSNEISTWCSEKANTLIKNCIINSSMYSSEIAQKNISENELINNIDSTSPSIPPSIPPTIDDISRNLSYDKFNQYSIKNEESIFPIKEVIDEENINEDIIPSVSIIEFSKDIKRDEKLSLNDINITHSITLDTQNSFLFPNETYISVDDPRNQLPVEDLVFLLI